MRAERLVEIWRGGFLESLHEGHAVVCGSDGAVIESKPFLIELAAEDAISLVQRMEFHTGTGDWQNATGMDSIITSLVDGEHMLFVRARDTAGNWALKQVTFMVDTLPPQVDIVTQDQGERINTSSPIIGWEIEDPSICGSSISIDGGTPFDTGANRTLRIVLEDGPHVLSLNVTDAMGHSTTISLMLIVDTVSPSVFSHGPYGSGVDENAEAVITFSEPMDVDSVNVEGMDGSMTWSGQTLTIAPFQPMEHGSRYTILVTGKDLAGNPLSPFSWSFEVDPLATIRGTVLDEGNRPVANVTVILDDNTTTTDTSGNFVLKAPPGNHTIVIPMEGYQDRCIEVEVTGSQIQISGNLEPDGTGLPNTQFILLGVLIAVGFLAVQMAIMKKRRR